MKKYLAVWGSLFFFVICFSLYLMLETLTLHTSTGIQGSGGQDNSGGAYEIKIQRIEGELEKNREFIQQIRDSVKKAIAGDKSALGYLDVVLGNSASLKNDNVHSPGAAREQAVLLKPTERVLIHLPENVCRLPDNPSKETTIQMLNVFDVLSFDNPDGGVWKQGWPVEYPASKWNNNNQRKLKVFIIPHSHTDPGWIKTFEQYYQQQTKFVFENMLTHLEQDPALRFIYAEISFLSLWWHEVDQTKRDRVKKLITSGQLEIVTGGWVMTDEANAHYFAMIDQMIEGHQWLQSALGVKPEHGWAIDPFGHTSTMAYLLKKMGINSMLIQRVHYSIKKYLAQKQDLEFIWRQHWDETGSTDILCHMMPFYSYDVPHTCGPNPKICCQFDFKRLPGEGLSCPWNIPPEPITENNVAERANMLLDQYRKKSELYKSNVVLVPLGDDFRYDTAVEWQAQTHNYGQLMEYMNSHPELNIQIQFGTLKEYFQELYQELDGNSVTEPASAALSILTGDFYSYADRDDHYWTGYFTSRPFYKQLDRVLENHLRSAEIAYSLAYAYSSQKIPAKEQATFPVTDFMQKLTQSRRSLALYQHHDGITGTAKDFVVIDYGKKLLSALMSLKHIMIHSLTYLLQKDKSQYQYLEHLPTFDIDEQRQSHDSLPDRTVLKLTTTPQPVMFYNSLGQQREELVQVHVNSADIEVTNSAGDPVLCQVDPVWHSEITAETDQYKVSLIVKVPALGMTTYYLKQAFNSSHKHLSKITFYNAPAVTMLTHRTPHLIQSKPQLSEFSIKSPYLLAHFSANGLLQSVTTKHDQTKHGVKVSFVHYRTKKSGDKSGAYLFLPDGEAKSIVLSKHVVRVVEGPLLSEVHLIHRYGEHVLRLSNSPGLDGNCVDVYNLVDIRSETNFEIAMRINTDIQNTDRYFYTDLNGFQIQKRKTYDKLPLQANFYPMPVMAFIQDDKTRFSVVSAQSLGCASLKPGQLEIMLDRRLNQDDNRGLAQPVIDNKRTPNRFRLLIESSTTPPNKNAYAVYPSLTAHWNSLMLISPVFVFPKSNNKLDTTTTGLFNAEFKPLSESLPCEIHLLNMKSLGSVDNDNTLRVIPNQETALLLHSLGFDCNYPTQGMCCTSSNRQVSLKNMFKDLILKKIVPSSLSLLHDEAATVTDVITINAMEIQTFKLWLQ